MRFSTLSPLLIWSLCLASVLAAVPLTPAQICAQSCYVAVSGLNFTSSPASHGPDIPPPSEYLCVSFLPVSSIFACFETFCDYPSTENNFRQLNVTCEGRLADYADTMAKADRRWLPRAKPDDSKTVFNSTVLPPKKKVYFLFKSFSTKQHMRHLNRMYGWTLFTIIACLSATASLIRLFHVINSWRKFNQPAKLSTFHKASCFIKKYITLPATFGRTHAESSILGKIPTRLEAIIISSYVGVNIILLCVGYPSHLGKEHGYIQNWKRVSGRASSLAMANMPTLFLFAGRNNLLLWITGASYSTFNLLHRWTARVITVEALIHTIGHMVLWVDDGGWPEVWLEWKERYMWTSVISFLAMIILNVSGNWQIRKRLYETFLAIHVPLSLVALVTLFYHVKITRGAFDPNLWPCVGFWVFDRFVRVARVLYSALFAHSTVATAVLDKELDMIKLHVRAETFHGKRPLRPAPGQYYFIYTSTGPLGIVENHPFSLMTWDNDDQGNTIAASRRSPANADLEKFPVTKQSQRPETSAHHTAEVIKEAPANNLTDAVAKFEDKSVYAGIGSPIKSSSSSSSVTESRNGASSSSAASSKDADVNTVGYPSLHFMLKPCTGMTSKLKEKILRSNSCSIQIGVAIEGPYGCHHDFRTYHRVILVAGGSGLTALLPYARDLSNFLSEKCTVKLFWSTRFYMSAYADVFFRDISSTEVYVTSGKIPSAAREVTGMNVKSGRINFQTLLEEETRAVEAGSRIAIVSCGPGGFCDDLRQEIVKVVGGNITIDYFEENFGW